MSIPIGRDHPETSREMAASKRSQAQSERSRVLAYLCDHEPCTTAEIADALGIVRNQAAISTQWLRQHDLARWMPATISHVQSNDFVRDRKDVTLLWATAPTGNGTRGILHYATEEGHRQYGRERMDAARRV